MTPAADPGASVGRDFPKLVAAAVRAVAHDHAGDPLLHHVSTTALALAPDHRRVLRSWVLVDPETIAQGPRCPRFRLLAVHGFAPLLGLPASPSAPQGAEP